MFGQGNPSLLLIVGIALLACAAAPTRAALIPADSKCVRSLDGVWRFKLEQSLTDIEGRAKQWGIREPIRTPATFETFYAPDFAETADWHDLAVPGNWEMAGFSPATYNEPDNSSGFYRRWIDIPADWKGRLVRLSFDAVQNGAEIWLNGKPVRVSEPAWGRENYHEGGWNAWQADLTPAAKFGEKNLLALRVTKNTKSSNLDSGDYYFLGGVHRTVTLFSVPRTHIQDITVRTKLLDGGKAEVRVIALVSGGEGSVSMRLGNSKPIVGAVGPDGKVELVRIVSKPRLWSAEHPNLYPLTVELTDSRGTAIEKVARKIGIREVSIKNGVLLVNGVPVKLAGVCRHDVYLSMGTAVNENVWRKDLELMRRANVNSVRTSHYPYGSRFYDLCDEMGFYVIDELPYCWCDTNDPELLPAFLQRARETIARDKNHPCVIIWGIGNENKSGMNLQPTADLVKELDRTRPCLVSCKKADEYGTDFDDEHYTAPAVIERSGRDAARRAKWPMIYTENPNVWDARMGPESPTGQPDFGCLDLWAQVLLRTWEANWKYDTIPGTFLWEWQDRAVCDKCPTKLYHFDPATGVNYFKTKGVVDGWRHPRPEYYHLKMIYSPIKIEPDVDFTSKPGSVVLGVTNRYSFTDLSELDANWKLLQRGKAVLSGTAHLKLAPRTSGRIELKLPEDWHTHAPEALRVDFDHPRGWNVVSHQARLALENPPALSKTLPESLKLPSLNLVHNETVGDKQWWRKITRYRASLINVKTDPTGDENLRAIRSLDADIVLDNAPSEVVGHVRAEYAEDLFKYRIEWSGKKADIQELGWAFEMPAKYDRFSWERKALWTVYPDDHIGRPKGTALPDSANVHLTNITRPDAFDFCSTKYDCWWASLIDAQDHGLRVYFDPEQQHHCRGGFGEDGAYRLVVNKQCSPPRDISTHTVEDLYLELKPGDAVEGEFHIVSQ